MHSILKKLVPNFVLSTLRDQLGTPSQERSLRQIKRLGFAPQYCLDVGAYEGHWATAFKKVFPDCAVLMIEGQREKEKKLIDVKNQLTKTDYCIGLLGAGTGEVVFRKYETASSVLDEHHQTNAITEKRRLVTLDSLLEKRGFYPDFIKIDTQGYELEVLKGGEKILACASFVLLEVSLIDIYVGSPLMHEVLGYMTINGFVTYDICSLMKRPLDGVLYQVDLLFTKKDSIFRKDKRWAQT